MEFVFESKVSRKTVPDNDDRTNEVSMKFRQKPSEFKRRGTAGKHREPKVQIMSHRRDGKKADRGHGIAFFAFDNDTRLTDGCPGSQKIGNQRKRGFVEKDDRPAVFTRLFLSAAICNAAMFQPPQRSIADAKKSEPLFQRCPLRRNAKYCEKQDILFISAMWAIHRTGLNFM